MLLLFFLFQSLLGYFSNPVSTIVCNPVTVNSITFQYYVHSDSIEMQLSAPTKGWVAVGFHHDAKLVGSDLLMFSVVDGKVIYQDQHIRGLNDHPEDAVLGGKNDIKIIGYLEDNESTTVKFKIPISSGDSFDAIHHSNRDFYLLLAYSTEDDFSHHSIVRKHLPYRFTF